MCRAALTRNTASADGGSGVPSRRVAVQQQRQHAFAAAVSLRLSTFVTVIFMGCHPLRGVQRTRGSRSPRGAIANRSDSGGGQIRDVRHIYPLTVEVIAGTMQKCRRLTAITRSVQSPQSRRTRSWSSCASSPTTRHAWTTCGARALIVLGNAKLGLERVFITPENPHTKIEVDLQPPIRPTVGGIVQDVDMTELEALADLRRVRHRALRAPHRDCASPYPSGAYTVVTYM